MARITLALVAAILVLPAAAFQEDDKELKKQEQQKADDEARAVVKAYHEKRKKARKPEDFADAITVLKDAKPHKLVRGELIAILDSRLPATVRIDAAAALVSYKKDVTACDALIRHAREERERSAEVLDLRRRCLRTFADIAPFGRSTDLFNFFSDQETALARQAIEGAEVIRSVRILKHLIPLLGELERIRDDEQGRDRGPGVPGEQQGQGDSNSKRKRKEELLNPTLTAINTIWGKVDSKSKFKNYTEANTAYLAKRADIKKIQDEEDAQDLKAAREQKP